MAEPQLSVRSAKARDLAHRLARRERRSIADIVERALEAYEIREAGREPAAAFYARLTSQAGSEIDLEAVIKGSRRPHSGIDLCFSRHRCRLRKPSQSAGRGRNGAARPLRQRPCFADRIFGLTEEAVLTYGDIMAEALRRGRPMSAPDGMIAAISRVNGGRLATRNRADFETTGLDLISPWEF